MWGEMKTLVFREVELTCISAASIRKSFCCWSRQVTVMLAPATCLVTDAQTS